MSGCTCSHFAIDVESSWPPVKTYIEKDMKASSTDKEPIYFDHYGPDALHVS